MTTPQIEAREILKFARVLDMKIYEAVEKHGKESVKRIIDCIEDSDRKYNSSETLSILTRSNMGKYKGYSVFEIDFNGVKVKMMSLVDIKELLEKPSSKTGDDK